jgi:uncharacterized protein (TIGR02996 family)
VTHEGAFLQDIVANPADDTPRLVYADWLDEHGDPGRAEFIRASLRSPEDPVVADLRQPLPAGCLVRQELTRLRGLGVTAALFRRGFVEEVELPCAAFVKHAAALFAAAPVTRVTLGDREPYPSQAYREYSCWFEDPHDYEDPHPASNLPADLFELLAAPVAYSACGWRLKRFPDAEAADALSRACVLFGRRAEAGPPAGRTQTLTESAFGRDEG